MKPIQLLARQRRQLRRMNEMNRVVREVVAPDKPKDAPDTFYAGSVDSSIERASVGWMPHDYKPIIGFVGDNNASG